MASNRQKRERTEHITLTSVDETPESGLPQSSMSYAEYRKFKKYKKDNEHHGMKTFPKKKVDQYKDVVEIDAARLKRHDTGAAAIDPTAMRSKFHMQKFSQEKKKLVARGEQTARAEILNKEEDGYLVPDDNELTFTIKQTEIAGAVDLASATKHFDLHLPQFGPYHISYTENGRHLLLGGHKGHMAALDWQTKHLHTENNVMQTVRDVAWLHTENLYAVAQKNFTFVYDNMGTELHCVKSMHDVRQLEFLPRHFLLVGATGRSFLTYLDVSVGQLVSSFATKCGILDVMCQNPANAIIHTGHGDGTVSLWSPNTNEPLVRMLAHQASVKGIAVDKTGKYMVTTGLDRKCRVWDVRMYRQLHSYSLPFGLNRVAVSQKMTVACAIGNTVQIFKDMDVGTCHEPYLVHRCAGIVTDLSFVPYEDVLGVGHAEGFTSVLVPGSGEANVDALRANPYETKSQRKEREVKQLLDKLQPDLICLDPDEISRVNEDLVERNIEERKKILYVRPLKVEYTPKHKMRGKGTGAHKVLRKNTVLEGIRRERNEEKGEMEREVFNRGGGEKKEGKKHVLDRFKTQL